MDMFAELNEILYAQPIDLPVFNPIAIELLHLLEGPDTDFFKVVSTIKEDQALSAHVLRMANSSSYIGRVCCDTIEKAAIRLGTHQIANLAIAASQASLHVSHHAVVHEIMQDLWLHSHACALGCRSIASMTGHQRLADYAYMAGLLHDIGKLYILKAMETICSLPNSSYCIDRELLVNLFSKLHVELGIHIMTAFHLPELYHQVVACHHAHQLESDIIIDRVLAIVKLVNFNSRRFQLDLYPTVDYFGDSSPELSTLTMDEGVLIKLEEVMLSARDSI